MKNFCFASLFFGLLSVLAACQQTAPIQGDAASSGAPSGKQPQANSDASQGAGIAADPGGEKIDPPQNIMGHYLHCAYEAKPTDAVPEALVGCRFDNSKGERVPASTLGAAYKFSSQLAAGSGLTVYSSQLATDNRYDAMFLYIGSSVQSVIAGVEKASITVAVTQVKSTGQDQAISAKFVDIQRDAATLPEPRTSDYSAVRNTILIEAQSTETPPPPAGN